MICRTLIIVATLITTALADDGDDAAIFILNSPFVDAIFWAVLITILLIQSIFCIRTIKRHASHRIPFTVLLISIILLIFCGILEIVEDIVPFETSGQYYTVYTMEGLFQSWWLTFWYASLVLFLRGCSDELHTATYGAAGQRNRIQIIIQALLFSMVTLLWSTDIALQTVSQSDQIPTHPFNEIIIVRNNIFLVENNVTYWIAYAFWMLAAAEIWISAYFVQKAIEKEGANHKLARTLFCVIAPLHFLNALQALVVEAIPPYVPDLIYDILNCICFLCSVFVLIFVNNNRQARLSTSKKPTIDTNALSKENLVPISQSDVSQAQHTVPSPTRRSICDDGRISVPSSPAESPELVAGVDNDNSSITSIHSTKTKISLTDNLLSELLKFQREQELARQEEKAIAAKEKEIARGQSKLTADSQVYTALSVVTIFIATLSVALISLAQQSTPASSNSNSNSNSSSGQHTHHRNNNTATSTASLASIYKGDIPTASDNMYSCFYLATFVSLLASCLSGLAAAVRNYMARDIIGVRPSFRLDGPVDRSISIVFIFVCLMMSMSIIALILGLLWFTWTVQTGFVAVAMTVPGAVFALALVVAIPLYIFPTQTRNGSGLSNY